MRATESGVCRHQIGEAPRAYEPAHLEGFRPPSAGRDNRDSSAKPAFAPRLRRAPLLRSVATHPVVDTRNTPSLILLLGEFAMFWIVLALVGLAALLLKLGALSVWVQLRSFVLLVLGGLLAIGAVVFLWRRMLRRA